MVHERLDAVGLGAPYRLAAVGLAEVVFLVPVLEGPFVTISKQLWRAPAVGRLIRSVAYRLAGRLRGTGREYRPVSIAGLPVRADASHWAVTDLYFANAEYEPQTFRYLADHLPEGGVFVDIGANAGILTIVGAARVGPGGRVFAFEPNPPVFDELQRHIQVNGFTGRVHPFGIAFSDTNGEAELHLSEESTGLSSLFVDTAPCAETLRASRRSVTVNTRRFDDWITQAGVDHVDLVKIDVEGAEDQVLNGMRESLAAGLIARVICETNPGSLAHQILIAHGYAATPLDDHVVVGNYAYEKAALSPS
jgi:FkbM family methyltransferase